MADMMTAQDNAAEYDRVQAEGRAAAKAGKPIHENPYDYVWQAVAANAWDDAWKGEGA